MGSYGKNTSILGSLGNMFAKLMKKERDHAKRKETKKGKARIKSVMRRLKRGDSKVKIYSRKEKPVLIESKKKSPKKKSPKKK